MRLHCFVISAFWQDMQFISPFKLPITMLVIAVHKSEQYLFLIAAQKYIM